MTPDERSILQQFLQDLAQARGAAKDPEADAMIAQTLRGNPDAAYLLVQHAILSDQALHAAQAQIDQAQGHLPTQQQPASFLSGGQQAYSPPAYDDRSGYGGGQPAPSYVQPSYAQPMQSSPMSSSGGLGNFLRNAGQMAAGVAAGDFLAQGLSNIFGGGGDRW